MRRFLSVILLVAVSASADSGPKHPKLPGLPGQPDAKARAVEGVVRQYVRDQAEEEGAFVLEDELLGRSWEAKLIAVRVMDLRKHADGRVSVCVDFLGADDKNSQPLDVDFVLSEGYEEWTVDDIHLHKVGQTLRFTYDKKLERVPVKKAGKGGKKPRRVPAGE